MGGGSPLKKWLALLPAFLWLAFLRLGELPPGNENSADAYYHVQMARLFPHAAMADQFPWTTLSIWENTFYDKELLFHGVVKVLDRLGRALGFSSEPPFHFTALALTAWVLATIWSVARSFRIPAPGWMLFALAALCPFFSHRMVELRPHLVSIALMVAFCGWARTYRRTEDLAIACGFGFVMAYAYSNPHFLLLPAVAFAIAIFPENRRLASLLPAAVLVGILVGLTFHPQFPNTFRLWKIQCVDVLRESFSGSRRVFLGGELYRPDALWLVRNGAIFIALAASVGIFEAL
ncbi:MAG: hypothetical protein JO317_02180, partial [Verrucomicrobiae bacterium]|nr:hypothetical protein [Verrucomicrobiae bacterium]